METQAAAKMLRRKGRRRQISGWILTLFSLFLTVCYFVIWLTDGFAGEAAILFAALTVVGIVRIIRGSRNVNQAQAMTPPVSPPVPIDITAPAPVPAAPAPAQYVTVQCPGCGAPNKLPAGTVGQCEYCGGPVAG